MSKTPSSSGYDYTTRRPIDPAACVDAAIEATVLNYFADQLGWAPAACAERTRMELARDIPRAVFDDLIAKRGWQLKGAKVLDVGAGQGGVVHELLSRGVDARGIEPGQEFCELARMRIAADGHEPERIHLAPGEELPFPDNTFDYVVSLQVLEHVPKQLPVLREMQRVLKRGGQAYVACENYLAFKEMHYRVRWLPLMPRPLGSLWLRRLGRDPAFFERYVFYTTYPQMLRDVRRAGFRDETETSRALPKRLRHHAERLFRPGIQLYLAKP